MRRTTEARNRKGVLQYLRRGLTVQSKSRGFSLIILGEQRYERNTTSKQVSFEDLLLFGESTWADFWQRNVLLLEKIHESFSDDVLLKLDRVRLLRE